MIRVLQVFTNLNRGGAETNIMNYYRNIDRSQFQFDFLVHRGEEGAYEKEIRELGGEIHRLPPLGLGNLYKYQGAVKTFFDHHPNYHIIHGNLSELGTFIYAEGKKRQVPVIIAHAHSSTRRFDSKTLFRYLLKKKMLNYLTAFFTCGIESSTYLFGRNNAPFAYQVNNAINLSKFVYDETLSQKIRKELAVIVSLNIVHVGSFNAIKNHKFLIEVFAEIIKLRPASHLFLVGTGELKNDIAARTEKLNLANDITFMGIQEDVGEILQAMDVFLFPSLFEGLPVSLVEAQASGLQCVISDGIPSEAIIVPENVTVISLKESEETWARKITALDFSGRQDVSQRIKDKGYDISDNVIKLENKYRELLENTGQPRSK